MSGIDIKLLGARELERKLKNLELRVQKRVVSAALRKSAKRIRGYVVDNLSGRKVAVITGSTRAAFQRAPVRSKSTREELRLTFEPPTRAELGISADDEYYYPMAIEVGHTRAPAKPFMRPAVYEHRDQELRAIGADVGRGIEREAAR